METISISHENISHHEKNKIKYKLHDIIEFSTKLFEKKSSNIMKELESLKKECLDQLGKFIVNCSFESEKSNSSILPSKSVNQLNYKNPSDTIKIKSKEKEKNNIKNSNKNVITTNSPVIKRNEIKKGSLKTTAEHKKVQMIKEVTASSFLNKSTALKSTSTPKNKIKNSNEQKSSLEKTNKSTVSHRLSPFSNVGRTIIIDEQKSSNKSSKEKDFLIQKKNKSVTNRKVKKKNEKKVINKSAQNVYNSDSRKLSDKSLIETEKIEEPEEIALKNNLIYIKNSGQDGRKFSILDIEASLSFGNQIKNLSEIKHYINFDYNHIKSIGIDNKYLMAFYIIAGSHVVPLKQRILFSSIKKVLCVNLPRKDIIRDYEKLIKHKIRIIGDELSKLQFNKTELLRDICPSKTAQNGLNFMTKEFENQLIISKDLQEIKKMFQVLHILLKENFIEESSSLSIVENIFFNIFPKYKVDSIKMLFLNVIYRTVFIKNSLNSSQVISLKKLIESNPILIDPSEMLKINVPVSYLCFSIKEIYDYINYKDEESGIEIYVLKYKLIKMKKLQIEREKLRKLF